MNNDPMTPIGPEESFRFSCTPEVACFNRCCRDLTQFLYPYDILRLKQNLGLTSDRFLAEYTVCHTGPESGLPVVSLKPRPESDERVCPFVSQQGCLVYHDRPASCRIYPLARAVSRCRQTGRVREHFALLREPHCDGFAQGRRWTALQWIASQQLAPYNRLNDMMLTIIGLKNQHRPGPLPMADAHQFYVALYDLDNFRRQVLENGPIELTDAVRQRISDDEVALLQWAMGWVQEQLFGLKSSIGN